MTVGALSRYILWEYLALNTAINRSFQTVSVNKSMVYIVDILIETTSALLSSIALTILLKKLNCSATRTIYPTRWWSAWTDFYQEEIMAYHNIMNAPKIWAYQQKGIYGQTFKIWCSREATDSKYHLGPIWSWTHSPIAEYGIGHL